MKNRQKTKRWSPRLHLCRDSRSKGPPAGARQPRKVADVSQNLNDHHLGTARGTRPPQSMPLPAALAYSIATWGDSEGREVAKTLARLCQIPARSRNPRCNTLDCVVGPSRVSFFLSPVLLNKGVLLTARPAWSRLLPYSIALSRLRAPATAALHRSCFKVSIPSQGKP